VSGTFGLAGAADTIIVIERRSSGWIFDVRGRDVTAEELGAKFDKDTCRWTILGNAAEVHRSTERSEQTPKQKKESPAQAMLEEVLTAALDQHSVEIKVDDKDAVRAVRKDTVRFAFKAAYQAKHADAGVEAERKAWRRALGQAKATVVESAVDGVLYLWRATASS
jgi:hypothetical protein